METSGPQIVVSQPPPHSLKTLGIISKFENLSNKSTPIISTLFSKNYLISADANSTVYVSNPDKQISKLNVFDKYHFQSKANFENIGPVKNLLPYTEESNSAVIYVSFEHSFILLNVSSGKFSKKINSVPCILDPSFPVCRSTAFNDEYLIKVDANTIIKFRNKGKYQEPLTNSYDLIFKKRFFNRIVGLSTTVDSHSLIVENNGVLNILKNDKGSGMIKAKLVIKENNNNNTNKPKRRRNQNSENIEKNESKAHFDNQKSQILSAHVLQASNIYILYGSDFNNFKLKILNFDEFLASADENKNILIKIDDSENTLSVREEIQNGQMVSTLIKSDKNLDFEDLSSHKRKLTVKEIKTIGETLEERLEENLLISEEASKTSSKNKSDLNTNDINSNDRSLTIAQALQAENINIVKDIVLESCENGEIIYYSIKNFGKSFIPLLVRVLRFGTWIFFIETDTQMLFDYIKTLNHKMHSLFLMPIRQRQPKQL